MDKTRALLQGWAKLFLEIRPQITTEDQVDSLVWQTHPLSPKGGTLLEALGYVQGEVASQERVKAGRTHWKPDFIVRKNGTPLIIIDDKSPQENLDKHKDQVVDYFLKVHAPLGLLFNGHEVKLLINTNLKELHQFELMNGEWVAETSLDDTEATLDVLYQLSAVNLGADAVSIAKRLAEKRMAEKRKEDIGNRLQEIMDNPPSELLESIIKMDAVL
ncbi:MAG: type I restriction enzyme HsdR N-terminal domain-containing protein, partial [Armatimonadota bacterium]